MVWRSSSASSGATVTAAPTSSIGLTASSLAASYSTTGRVVAYRYVVTNTGQTTLHGVAVTDAGSSATRPAPSRCSLRARRRRVSGPTWSPRPTSMRGRSRAPRPLRRSTPACRCLVVGRGGDRTRVDFTVAVTDRAGGRVGIAETGDSIAYRYLVSNLSSVTVHGISIGDDHLATGDITCPQATLAPLASRSAPAPTRPPSPTSPPDRLPTSRLPTASHPRAMRSPRPPRARPSRSPRWVR